MNLKYGNKYRVMLQENKHEVLTHVFIVILLFNDSGRLI